MNTTQERQTILLDLYYEHFGEQPTTIIPIPPSGSDRVYWIFKSANHEAVGAFNEDLTENRTFFYFTEVFLKHGIHVPKIYNKGNNKGAYLIEYIESDALLDWVKKEGHTDAVKTLYKKSIDQLIKVQWVAGREINYEMCFANEHFDKEQILSDLLYFKYYFLDLLKIKYNKIDLLKEMQEMAAHMAGFMPKAFMYRDFQSRNILIKNNQPYFIDYQGGMEGIPQYDIASLLWQARAELPTSWKNELSYYYFEQLSKLTNHDSFNEIELKKVYFESILLRMMQTLGAYGYRGLIEKKAHFIQSIVPALKQLQAYLNENPTTPAYEEMRKVLQAITVPEFIEKMTPNNQQMNTEKAPLNIHLYSFSYKKGQAVDPTGNGGGYVFDCRGILNPGRQEAYKQQTGMDQPVAEYLASETRMPEFLENIWKTIDITIEEYIQRGFENLTISFGCTGGQHRSVYAAEQTFRYIQEKYNINSVNKLHLEQEANDKKRSAL